MERFGNQHPTESVILPYVDSYGDDAVQIYEKGRNKLMPWQKYLLKDTLGYNDEGLFVHQRFGVAVSRRNGKSEYILPICEWALIQGLQVAYTAHRTSTSKAVWERLERHMYDIGYQEEDIKVTRRTGDESITLRSTKGRVMFRTRTKNGGLGEGFDILIIDEAQEYTIDEESALKYTVSAAPNPITIMIGTPPTTASHGTVFMNFRNDILKGNIQECGWAEWSVESMTDPYDVDAWYRTNPSLGYVLKERTIRAEITGDDTDFNIQRLGLWLKYNVKSAITEAEWDDCTYTPSKSELEKDVCLGIKYGKDRTHVAMSLATKMTDGRIFVECLGCHPIREGNDWLLRYVRALRPIQVVVDGATEKTLIDTIHQLRLSKCIEPTVPEVIEGNSRFEKAIFEKTICHNGQPSLRAVVSNCEHRAIGSKGGYGYASLKAELDIVLLDATMLALWGRENYKERKVQKVYY